MPEAARAPLPPYMPYKSLGTFFDHLRAIGIPSHIDRSVMSSMSGAMQSWLKSTLRYLQLIDADDVPQPRLAKLVNAQGDERKALLADLFKQAYGFLDGKIDLKNTTPQKLRAAVVELGAQGDTVDKIMAFMIAMAKDAGIPLSKLLTTRAPSVRRPRTKPATTQRNAPEGGDEDDDEHDDEHGSSGTAMKVIELPKAGGTLTLSGNINLFALVGPERDLVFALIDTMRKFEESQENGGE